MLGLLVLVLTAAAIALGAVSMAQEWLEMQVISGVVVAAIGLFVLTGDEGSRLLAVALLAIGAVGVLLAYLPRHPATDRKRLEEEWLIEKGRRGAERVRRGSAVDRFLSE